jgi:hypothetical protein
MLGEYTSVNYNGCSVVDYIAAIPNLSTKVDSFKVQKLTKFSDHEPLIGKIRSNAHTIDALMQRTSWMPSKMLQGNIGGTMTTKLLTTNS